MFSRKTIYPALALIVAGASMFSMAASGKTLVGDQQIDEADMPAVIDHCAALAETTPDADVVVDGSANDGAAPVETSDNTEAPLDNDAAEAGVADIVSTVDLEAITLDDCMQARLTP